MATQLNERPIGRQLSGPVPAHRSEKEEIKPIDPKLMAILIERRVQFLRFLQKRLGDRDEAEDVLQDFYLRVLLKGDQIRDGNSIVAWLHTVLKSVMVDHFRREATRRDAHQLMAAEWLATSLQDETAKADEEAFDRVACTCFYRLLPTLKSEYAEVLTRVDLAQEERAKTANALGITPGNMRVRLHRARHALKEVLETSCRQCREHDCFGQGGPSDRHDAKDTHMDHEL